MRAKDCVCQTLATMTKDPAACESVALHQFNKACVGMTIHVIRVGSKDSLLSSCHLARSSAQTRRGDHSLMMVMKQKGIIDLSTSLL